MCQARAMRGFTLVEMITVMVIAGILAGVVWRAIAPQIEGFQDTAQRAKLVDITDTALSRMTRELRLALPNSVRVNAGGTAVEFLRSLTGGRYRVEPDGTNNDVCAGPDSDSISLTATTDCFEALGGLPNVAQIIAQLQRS
ncbi:MAG: PulJ/GspJ family protein, partial [Gammaproteobacteria bacterium]